MIDALTPDSIAASVMLLRDVHTGSFLILEGTSDIRLYAKFVDASSCQVINAFNKANVVAVIEILDDQSFVGAIAIVDADFWAIEGYTHASPNIFVTDTHDLETMMLRSQALDDVVREFGSETKISRFQSRSSLDVRQVVIQAAVPVGCLRLISKTKQMNLRFKGVRYSSFTSDKKKLEISVRKLTSSVCNQSQRYDIDKKLLAVEIGAEMQKGHDPWQLCNGHDAVALLALSLRRLLGSNNANDVKQPLLERSLRLAFQSAHFRETNLFDGIAGWEANFGYRVIQLH